MIATIPRGRCGIDGSPAQSLLAEAVLSLPNKAIDKPLRFAGGLSLGPEALLSKPAVLLPLFRDFGPTMQATVDHLHQVQKVTQGFRVVVTTDMPIFKSLRPYGWAISHVQSEMQWALNNGSWCDYVKGELLGVARDFGVQSIFDFSSEKALYGSWKRTLAIAGLPESLAPSNVDLSNKLEHYSWRGWLPKVPSGGSCHEVQANDSYRWNIEIHKSADSSMLFVSEKSSKAKELASIAQRRGWNTALLSVLPTRPPQVQMNAAILHLFDGLSLDGAGLVGSIATAEAMPPQLHATMFVDEVNVNDLDRAERMALAFWSSRR